MKLLLALFFLFPLHAISGTCDLGRRLTLSVPVELDNSTIFTSSISICSINDSEAVKKINEQLKHRQLDKPDNKDFFAEITNKLSNVYNSGDWPIISQAYLVGDHAYLNIKSNKKEAFTYIKLRIENGNIELKTPFSLRDPLGVFLMSLETQKETKRKEGKIRLMRKNSLFVDGTASTSQDKEYETIKEKITKAILEKNHQKLYEFFGNTSKETIAAWIHSMPPDTDETASLIQFIFPAPTKRFITLGDLKIAIYKDKKDVFGRTYIYKGKFYNFASEINLDSILWLIDHKP